MKCVDFKNVLTWGGTSPRTQIVCGIGLTIALFLLTAISGHAQKTKAQIKNVDFELVNNKVIITYDIIKHQYSEMFKIWVKVYTAQENELKAKALTGSVGENVAGGNKKKIIWDVNKDGVHLNNDIYVEVLASPMGGAESSASLEEFSMGKWLLLSSVYPGLGNAKLHSKKAWWVTGAVTYGCIAASVIFNSQSYNKYNDYLVSSDIDQRSSLYDAAVKNKNLSIVFISAAATIWAADLLWLAVKSKKAAGAGSASNKTPVSLGYAFYPNNGNLSQQLSVRLIF